MSYHEASQYSREAILQAIRPTPEYLSRLHFTAYGLTRGSNEAMENIGFYIRFLHPDWNISEVDFERFREIFKKQSDQYLHAAVPKGFHSSDPNVIDPVRRARLVGQNLDIWKIGFSTQPSNVYPLHIGISIIEKDQKYILQGKQSLLVEHGIRGKSTGIVEYDCMFQDIMHQITRPSGLRFKGNLTDKATFLIENYNSLYPNNPTRLNLGS